MLQELRIKNFAIIEEQSIEFGSGLNVLTGETGAGKSVVLQAIQLILGARPSPKYLRKDTDGWQIDAVFSLVDLPEDLRNGLPDIAQGDELVVTRCMSSKGKGRVYINGSLGTVSVLESITHRLLSICGQNQQSMLLDPEYHRVLLDDFAENRSRLVSYQDQYRRWKELSQQLEQIEVKRANNALRQAELSFLIDELRAKELHPDLRSELEEQVETAGKSQQAITQANSILEQLQSVSGVSAGLHAISKMLRELAEAVDLPSKLTSRISIADDQIVEFEKGLIAIIGNIEVDDRQLEQAREDLAEVARLERKYKTNCQGLVELLQSAESELELLEDEVLIDELREELESLEANLKKQAKELSQRRAKAAERLAKDVSKELSELNMQGTKLVLDQKLQDLGPYGEDRLEFLISTNPGEDPKPLRLIASGGELSRITLVLKKLLRDRSGVNVLVFDEVDTGISGSVARAVGTKLKDLAKHSQVLCITHLAQVASLSDRHILVEKKLGKRTMTILRELDANQQVEEIARMLAGYDVTEASRESAKELLTS